jgi:hypothetical protein
MRRRQMLAGSTALLSVPFAGCAFPSISIRMSEPTTLDVLAFVSTRVNKGSKEYDVLKSAIKNGTAIRTGRTVTGEDRLFEYTNTALLNDTVYEINETRVDSENVLLYDVGIDFKPQDTNPTLGAIKYDELPGVDRDRLKTIISGDLNTQDFPGGGNKWVEYDPTQTDIDSSVFVPHQQYDILQYNGKKYPVTVNTDVQYDVTYQYNVTKIASSVEVFAEQIYDTYLFKLNGLSSPEREVVNKAIETEGYFTEDDAAESVMGKIRDHTALDQNEREGNWLLEYDNTEYFAVPFRVLKSGRKPVLKAW